MMTDTRSKLFNRAFKKSYSLTIRAARYIRSFLPLDDLERRARYPPVDKYGLETVGVRVDQAGSHGE